MKYLWLKGVASLQYAQQLGAQEVVGGGGGVPPEDVGRQLGQTAAGLGELAGVHVGWDLEGLEESEDPAHTSLPVLNALRVHQFPKKNNKIGNCM